MTVISSRPSRNNVIITSSPCRGSNKNESCGNREQKGCDLSIGCWLSPVFQSVGCHPFLGHEFSLEDHSQHDVHEIDLKKK